jgi:hypothetical protein
MIKPRRIRWADYVEQKGERRNAYRILMGKLDGKTPLRISRHRWANNIKMYLRETSWVMLTGLIWLRIELGGGLS